MFSIVDIIGRNPLAVERLVGKEDKSEFIKSKNSIVHIKTYYRKGGIEITYIDHIADHVIVYGKEKEIIEEFINFLEVRFIPTNTNYLGTVRYYKIAGLVEVAFYGNREGNIDKVNIKAFTA